VEKRVDHTHSYFAVMSGFEIVLDDANMAFSPERFSHLCKLIPIASSLSASLGKERSIGTCTCHLTIMETELRTATRPSPNSAFSPKRVLVLPRINSLAHTGNSIVVLKQQERDSKLELNDIITEPISTAAQSSITSIPSSTTPAFSAFCPYTPKLILFTSPL